MNESVLYDSGIESSTNDSDYEPISTAKTLPRSKKKISCDYGCATISDVTLRYTDKLSKKYKRQFLCTLEEGSSLFYSKICESNSEGLVDFNIKHTFTNLPLDFKINLKIHILSIRKRSRCENLVKKLVSLFYKNPKPKPSFSLWKETVITFSNLNQTNEVFLDLVQYSYVQKLSYNISATFDTSKIFHSGWVDVSQNELFWNQRWCVLRGTQLNFYYHPSDACLFPIFSLDLAFCKSVKSFTFSQFRSRVFLVEFEDGKHCYMSLGSDDDFCRWQLLETLVSNLKYWNPIS